MDELLVAGRSKMPLLQPDKRKYNLIEVCQGLTAKQAITEAKRCLRCDLETDEGRSFLEKLKENYELKGVEQ